MRGSSSTSRIRIGRHCESSPRTVQVAVRTVFERRLQRQHKFWKDLLAYWMLSFTRRQEEKVMKVKSLIGCVALTAALLAGCNRQRQGDFHLASAPTAAHAT